LHQDVEADASVLKQTSRETYGVGGSARRGEERRGEERIWFQQAKVEAEARFSNQGFLVFQTSTEERTIGR
jgi:hypothetical protein